jgi:transcriptional regulator with XRE-family HTH domain
MPEGDFLMSDFGEKLIELRNKSKLSLKEICKQVGIPLSRLVELEKGVRIPTQGQIEHLEKFYGVNSGALTELSQKMEKTDR